jgi:hypothetical protein
VAWAVAGWQWGSLGSDLEFSEFLYVPAKKGHDRAQCTGKQAVVEQLSGWE